MRKTILRHFRICQYFSNIYVMHVYISEKYTVNSRKNTREKYCPFKCTYKRKNILSIHVYIPGKKYCPLTCIYTGKKCQFICIYREKRMTIHVFIPKKKWCQFMCIHPRKNTVNLRVYTRENAVH